MKLPKNNLVNNLLGVNPVNSILKSGYAEFFEQNSSSDSLLTLLDAGIKRQSQGDANEKGMFSKTQDTSFDVDVSKSAKRIERGPLIEDLTRWQLEVIRKPKSKHNELPSEEVEIGSETKHKNKNKKYTDASENDFNNVEIDSTHYSDNAQKKKRNRSLNLSADPTVANEIVKKKKSKHREVPSEEIEIGSEPKQKKKHKKCADASVDDFNNVEIDSTHYSDNAQKKTRNRSLNLSADPTVADEIVGKKKGKHKEVPSEEIEIGSEPKQKKKHKKDRDTSEGDYNDNTQKKKHDKSVNLSDIIEEPTVGDETIRKTKGKHKGRPSEEVEIGSEFKRKKKKKKYTDTSEDDVNNVEINSTHYSDNAQEEKRNRSLNLSDVFADPAEVPSEEIEIESEPKRKKKHKKIADTNEDDCNDNTQKKKDRSMNSSDIIEGLTVGDETVRKTKGKHKERSSEEVEIVSELKHKKKNKKYTNTSEDDVNNVKVNSTHYSDNTQRPNRRLNFSDVFADPAVADEIVRKKKGKHTKVPSGETEIGSGPKQKKKHVRSMNLSDVIEEPTVEDETVRNTKGKHKELPSEEVEIESERKHKKKKKRDRSVSSNDIIVEPAVGDETVGKKKSKRKGLPSEEVEIESERKNKKKKKHTDASDGKIIRDISIISSDLNSEPSVVDNSIREKKKRKHKKFPQEEIKSDTDESFAIKKRKKYFQDVSLSPLLVNGIEKHKKAKRQKLDDRFSTMMDNIEEHRASGLEPFKLPKSNKEASLDITDANLIHSNIHSSTPFEAGKKSRSFTPPKDDSALTDESVKSMEDTQENVSDSDDPYYDNLLKENKPRASKARSAIQHIRIEKPKLHDDAKFLEGLHVLIPFDVPQAHLIETRISTKPTQPQKERFKSLKVPMSTRPYTKAEDASIKANWEEFCRTHDLPNKPELFMSLATENALYASQRINFARFLGRGLEHRMLFSIYGRFKVLFGTYKKGKFTPEEDATIRDIMQTPNVANKFSTLATMLGRSRESIKCHYKVLNSEKVTWSLELMKELIENLMKVVGKEDIDELKTAAIERPHWEELEKLMGISGVKLRLKWMEYIYPRLFAGNNNNVNEVRTKLVNLLYDNSKYDRKEINWNELALDFDGMSGNRLYKIFVDLMNSCVPKNVKNNFKDAIDYLKNDYLVGLQTSTPRSFVKLHYENGKLWESRIRT